MFLMTYLCVASCRYEDMYRGCSRAVVSHCEYALQRIYNYRYLFICSESEMILINYVIYHLFKETLPL